VILFKLEYNIKSNLSLEGISLLSKHNKKVCNNNWKHYYLKVAHII
jgi:hypothetical protein